MNIRILPVVTALFLFGLSAVYAEDVPEAFEKELAEKMNLIEDISFSFEQKTYIDRSTQTVKADVFFRRPDYMKIIYSEPRKQELYYYEGNLYTFIPGISQATKQRKKGLTDLLGASASLIFTGGDLSRLKSDYGLSFTEEENPILKARPLKEAGYDLLEVGFEKESLLPKQTVVTAPHIRSVTEFSEYTVNSGLSEEDFLFAPSGRINLIEID